MIIVTGQSSPLRNDTLAVPLALYAQSIHWDECSFWGVNRPPPSAGYPTFAMWTKPERDMVTRYLGEAQEEIEAVLEYRLRRAWTIDERHKYSWPLVSKWGHVVAAGIKASDAIVEDADVDHTTDPAVVAVATTITDIDEIYVYYPASLGVEGPVEITPSDVDIAGGIATIHIPRCRLVHPDQVNNPSTGLEYTDLDNFLDIVDVYRVHNDPSVNGTLIWPHACTGTLCSCPTCSEYTQTACIYVANGEVGSLHLLPGEYSDGAWSKASSMCCGRPGWAEISYCSGLTDTPTQATEAIIRLAHSKMPQEPCTDDRMQKIWERDIRVPVAPPRERHFSLFGISDGAWTAWQFVQTLRLWRSSDIE